MNNNYESAEILASRLLDLANPVDDQGIVYNFAKGFASFPVTLYWLGYDFIHAEDRSANLDDKFRFAKLIKSEKKLNDSLKLIVETVVSIFISKIDMEAIANMSIPVASSFAGKLAFARVSQVSLGKLITSRIVGSTISGWVFGGLLTIGGEVSKAIYTSRELRDRNQSLYYTLKNMGDLDLLYFLVQEKLEPIEDACKLAAYNRVEFNAVCKYFLEGLDYNAQSN